MVLFAYTGKKYEREKNYKPEWDSLLFYSQFSSIKNKNFKIDFETKQYDSGKQFYYLVKENHTL